MPLWGAWLSCFRSVLCVFVQCVDVKYVLLLSSKEQKGFKSACCIFYFFFRPFQMPSKNGRSCLQKPVGNEKEEKK